MSHQTFSHWHTRQKQQSFILSLFHTLQYARQEAVTRNTVVQIIPRSLECTYTWSQGIELFTDKLSLRILQNDEFNNLTSNQPCGFRFTPDGRCTTPGTLTLHSLSGHSQSIVINDSGRIRLKLAESHSVHY